MRLFGAYAIGSLLLFILTAHGQTQEEIFTGELSAAALMLTEQEVVYDPGYYAIDYPNGYVLIRAYRVMNIDLQEVRR